MSRPRAALNQQLGLDVLTVGTPWVELYSRQLGVRLESVGTFSKTIGGGPAGVAVATSRLHRRTAVLGTVGNDPFGRYFRSSLVGFGVDDRYVVTDNTRPTSVAFPEDLSPSQSEQWPYRHPAPPGCLSGIDAVRAARLVWLSAADLHTDLGGQLGVPGQPGQITVLGLDVGGRPASPAVVESVRTGAVTVCFPQDVQAAAFDWPVELFERRVWHIARPLPETRVLAAAAELIRTAKRPLIVAGGGVHYSGATEALAAFCEATGIPVGQTQAGKGTLVYDHPQCLGAIGSTGTTASNAVAADADLVIGIGTRYSDFTTASRTAFADPGVGFVNINVAGLDAVKQSGLSVVADARETLTALTGLLDGHRVEQGYVDRYTTLDAEWEAEVERVYAEEEPAEGLLTQNSVIGAVNEVSDPRDVVVCAAGSMPGDLHKLWRTRDPKGYHVEYGYSCMGYEIAGGLGVAMACPDRDVFVMVGDGSYLVMATAVQEHVKIITVLVQNHGYASIGALSESLGSQRFGTRYRYRNPASGRLDGENLPFDLAGNAASFGLEVLRATTRVELADAIKVAKAGTEPIVIYVETDPLIDAPSSESWWDVPVSATLTLECTQQARTTYEEHKARQRLFLTPPSAR